MTFFLSLQKCDLANYADDSTLYTSDKIISNIMNSLNFKLNWCMEMELLKKVNKKKY